MCSEASLHLQTVLLGEISEAIEADERATARQRKTSRPAPTPLSLPGSGSSSLDDASVTSLLLAELTDTLSSATELAHTQAARLLSYRSEVHASIPLHEFVQLFIIIADKIRVLIASISLMTFHEYS